MRRVGEFLAAACLAVAALQAQESGPTAAERGEAGSAAERIGSDADTTRDAVREIVRRAVAREVDEAIRFGGERARLAAERILTAQRTAPTGPTPPTPPVGSTGAPAPPPPPPVRISRRPESAERAYDRGQRALDARRWDEALEAFTAASKKGSRVEGALYWKAYVLNKLGRRDEALAAIAELAQSHPSSRWLGDAKALEVEIRQAAGQPVRPEAETDDDLKVLALNGLVQTDPDRAVPLLEKFLQGTYPPRLKERALFVIAQSSIPRARQLLEQVARGSTGNPDLQLKAIRYAGAVSRKGENSNLLWEIYSSSNDVEVRRAALSSMVPSRDRERLLQAARTDKSPELRLQAIGMLGSTAVPELAQMYRQETSVEVKARILAGLAEAKQADRLAEVVREEKDPKLRRAAIRALGAAPSSADTLVALYAGEPDASAKEAALDGLTRQKNAKALIDLARKEQDPKMKREIVGRLSTMKSKEASDYLLELLQ